MTNNIITTETQRHRGTEEDHIRVSVTLWFIEETFKQT